MNCGQGGWLLSDLLYLCRRLWLPSWVSTARGWLAIFFDKCSQEDATRLTVLYCCLCSPCCQGKLNYFRGCFVLDLEHINQVDCGVASAGVWSSRYCSCTVPFYVWKTTSKVALEHYEHYHFTSSPRPLHQAFIRSYVFRRVIFVNERYVPWCTLCSDTHTYTYTQRGVPVSMKRKKERMMDDQSWLLHRGFRTMLFVLFVMFKLNPDVNEWIFCLRVSPFLFTATKGRQAGAWLCFGSRFLIFILPFRNEGYDVAGRCCWLSD